MADSPYLSLEVRRLGRRVVVAVDGELDAYSCAALRHCLEDLIQAQGNLFVDVDLSRVRFMDSSGLGLLARSHRSLTRRGGTFALVGVPSAARRALEVAGLLDTFTTRPSRDADDQVA